MQDSAKHWINQEEKVEILATEGLIKMATAPKAVPEKSEKGKHRKAAEANEQSPAESEKDTVSEASAAESEEDTVSEEAAPKKIEKKPRAKRAKKPDDEATKKSPSASKKKKTKNGDN